MRVPWYCTQSLSGSPVYRFELDEAYGCELPFGVPNRLFGGTCHHDDGAYGCTTFDDPSYKCARSCPSRGARRPCSALTLVVRSTHAASAG